MFKNRYIAKVSSLNLQFCFRKLIIFMSSMLRSVYWKWVKRYILVNNSSYVSFFYLTKMILSNTWVYILKMELLSHKLFIKVWIMSSFIKIRFYDSQNFEKIKDEKSHTVTK